jgi:hypothetical protein
MSSACTVMTGPSNFKVPQTSKDQEANIFLWVPAVSTRDAKNGAVQLCAERSAGCGRLEVQDRGTVFTTPDGRALVFVLDNKKQRAGVTSKIWRAFHDAVCLIGERQQSYRSNALRSEEGAGPGFSPQCLIGVSLRFPRSVRLGAKERGFDLSLGGGPPNAVQAAETGQAPSLPWSWRHLLGSDMAGDTRAGVPAPHDQIPGRRRERSRVSLPG